MLLALGFTGSAFGLYAALWLIGANVLGDARSTTGLLLVAGVLGFLLGLDSMRARRPGATGPSWRRQTPKHFRYRYGSTRAALLWGLDAGLVVTTYRVTSLSWAALAVTFFGVVPWWSGLAYALGFSIPLLAVILSVPKRTDPMGQADPEPVWILERIMDSRGALKVSALLMMGGALWSCLALAMRA